MINTGTNTGKAAFAAALAAVVVGAGVLAGWFFGLEFLKRIAPGLVAMNPATAAAFILAGASLALFLQPPHGKDQKSRALILTARLCALVVALIGLAKLADILYDCDLNVDQWLFASKLSDDLRFPNRMAPNTAFSFLLLGSALLFVDVKNRSARFWSEFSVVLVGLGSLLAVLAYAYDIQSFYGLSAFIPMALPTAITFSVLAFAFLLSHTDSGLLAILAGDSGAGGTMARRLLPAAVLVPAVFGWLALKGEEVGIYHGTFGDAVEAVGDIFIFAFLVCWSAQSLFNADLGRKKAEKALRESQGLYHSLVEQLPANIYRKDAEGRFVFVNSRFCRSKGRTAEEILGQTASAIDSKEMTEQVTNEHELIMRTGESVEKEESYPQPDGTVQYLQILKSPVFAADGKIIGTQGIQFDITGRKRMEEQLFQSQKMETVGKLAGGVAHEFNSILTAIICQSELLLEDLPAGSPLAENATEIRSAAERAAVLTRQLLAYGRKQFLQPEILDLNAVLAGLASALRHLLGPGADVRLAPAAGLKAVKADAGQLEQVIMNLAMNARDAMPNGGKLTLETAAATLDEEYVSRYPELKAGKYVMLAITDTGMGMSEEVKARVFEPFFTTKDVGQGTGLGLSTCYGILKQSGGHISVYSEPGRGTTFKIYLPQVEPLAKNPLQRLASPDLPRGTETILLVEDDPALREMAATLLRRLGYTVLAAANGVEALSLSHQPDTGRIDLLFTDVVMPHMSGKELADRVRALSPHTRILFTSGYTENTIVQQGGLNQGVAFLQKPFTPSVLARKVREVLDQVNTPEH
jgi:PAS domain S-box-containing protein